MVIRIGTNERDGTFHTQGLALKTVLDRIDTLAPVEVLESAQASIDNANRLHSGELDFGFMASNWIGRARLGEAPFAQPVDLRMAAPMNAGPLFFIARADSPIRVVADLRGRCVAVGPRYSGMTRHAHCIFGVLGVGFADFTPDAHFWDARFAEPGYAYGTEPNDFLRAVLSDRPRGDALSLCEGEGRNAARGLTYPQNPWITCY